MGSTGTIVCNAPSVPVGARYVIDVRVRVAATTPPGAMLTNAVVVAAATPDPDPTNNQASVPTLVVAPGFADVAIVKTDAPDPQAAGAAVSYGFAVTNNGPSVATNVTVTDTLPPGTAFVSGSAGCTAAGTTVTCTVGTLTPGASPAVGIVISTPPQPGTITNTVTVSASEPDPIPANNTEPEDTTLVQRADVQIVKTGPSSATPGAPLVYTLVVTNNGPSIADLVTVTDATPAGLSSSPTAARVRRRSRCARDAPAEHVGDHHVHLQRALGLHGAEPDQQHGHGTRRRRLATSLATTAPPRRRRCRSPPTSR